MNRSWWKGVRNLNLFSAADDRPATRTDGDGGSWGTRLCQVPQPMCYFYITVP